MTSQTTAIILQGGGALGAYQAGVYEELAAHDIAPDWIIGTSIGAINGAIIAGNKPEDRLALLKSFWQSLAPASSWLDAWSPASWLSMATPFAPYLAAAAKEGAVFGTIAQGVPGFFSPRFGAAFDLDGQVALEEAGFYDTSPMRQTLIDHVDFGYLKTSPIRLSVCAVDVETAELRTFDSRKEGLGPEHIMASGALPPAFPPIVIDKRAYWDGGIYSNTPLEVLLAEARQTDALAFMIDLWDPTETLPTTMNGVMDRLKSIQFTGRTSAQICIESRIDALEQAIRLLSAEIPEARLNDPEIAKLAALGCDRTVNVVRLIMKALEGDTQFKDVDFSSTTVSARWAAGKADAARALKHKAWLKPVPPHAGLVIHELEQI